MVRGYETEGQACLGLATDRALGFPTVTKLKNAIINLIIWSDQNISYKFVSRVWFRSTGVPTTPYYKPKTFMGFSFFPTCTANDQKK